MNIKILSTVILLIALTTFSLPLMADYLEVFQIEIENEVNAGFGDVVDIAVNYNSGSEAFVDLHFLISYNASNLQFLSASIGNAPDVCNWEYFDYQLIPCADCDTNLIEINLIADNSGIPGSPATCFDIYGELFNLHFRTPFEASYAGQHLGIDFYWENCESNVMHSPTADTIWHCKFIYDYMDINITGLDPKYGGTLPECIFPGGTVPIRAINLKNGGITMTADSGLWGDINGDGKVNITDCYYLIRFLFEGGPPPLDYLSGDLNESGVVDLNDALLLFDYVFGLN